MSVLNSLLVRQVRLCRYDDAPVVPGWPSSLDRKPAPDGCDRAMPPSAHSGSSSRLDEPALQPGLSQGVRRSSGAQAAGPDLSSVLSSFASFGDPTMRMRESAAHTGLLTLTDDAPGESP